MENIYYTHLVFLESNLDWVMQQIAIGEDKWLEDVNKKLRKDCPFRVFNTNEYSMDLRVKDIRTIEVTTRIRSDNLNYANKEMEKALKENVILDYIQSVNKYMEDNDIFEVPLCSSYTNKLKGDNSYTRLLTIQDIERIELIQVTKY
jgi:hypothetical protein